MDQDKMREIVKIINELKSHITLMKGRLWIPEDKINIAGLQEYSKERIKTLKTLANPKTQTFKNDAKDQEIYAMIDTLTGLLKKCDKNSLESFIEICDEIKIELGVKS